MPIALTRHECDEAVALLPGWIFEEERNALHRTITFSDFSETFGTMTRIAIAAEKLGHHPE